MTLFQFIRSMLSALQATASGVRLAHKPSSVGSELGYHRLRVTPLVTSYDHFAARWQQCGQLSIVTNFNFVHFLLSRL